MTCVLLIVCRLQAGDVDERILEGIVKAAKDRHLISPISQRIAETFTRILGSTWIVFITAGICGPGRNMAAIPLREFPSTDPSYITIRAIFLQSWLGWHEDLKSLMSPLSVSTSS